MYATTIGTRKNLTATYVLCASLNAFLFTKYDADNAATIDIIYSVLKYVWCDDIICLYIFIRLLYINKSHCLMELDNSNKVIDDLFTKSNVKRYFEKINYYSKCNILEYLKMMDKKNTYYESVESKKQIRTIIDYSIKNDEIDLYLRLIKLLAKHIKINDYVGFIKELYENNINDEKIYKSFSYKSKYRRRPSKGGKYNKSVIVNINNENSYRFCTNNYKKVNFFKNVPKLIASYNKNFKLEKYLDIGCGDCVKTKKLGLAFGLKLDDIYGADIPQWSGYSDQSRGEMDINFRSISINKKLPFDDKMFSLVSAFMVLHHFTDLDLKMREINRITKKDGYLLITEHDAFTDGDKMLADVEHSLFHFVHRDNTYDDIIYSRYYDWIELDLIMEKYGFELLKYSNLSLNVKEEIQMTRYVWGIYKKVKDL